MPKSGISNLWNEATTSNLDIPGASTSRIRNSGNSVISNEEFRDVRCSKSVILGFGDFKGGILGILEFRTENSKNSEILNGKSSKKCKIPNGEFQES